MSRSLLTLAFGLALMLALGSVVGCSDNSPLSPAASTSISASPGATHGSTEIYGRVASIDPAARTMSLEGNATPILIDESAEVVLKDSGNETPIELTLIQPGDSAEVRGVMSAGSLIADRVRIRLLDDNGGNETELSGRISTVDPAARTITLRNNSLVITVLANAEIVKKYSGMETPISLSEINPMDSVDIRGTMQPDGLLAADRVRIRIGGLGFNADLEFKATIASIDYAAGTFMVDSRGELITTDANTKVYVKSRKDRDSNSGSLHDGDDDDIEDEFGELFIPIEFADLNAGDSVEVYANMVDANTLYAVAIELEDGAIQHAMEIEFKATIATIDAANGMVTFQGQPWTGTLLPGADLAGLNNEPLNATDFSAGELVEVKGFRTGDATFDIVRMHKDNN